MRMTLRVITLMMILNRKLSYLKYPERRSRQKAAQKRIQPEKTAPKIKLKKQKKPTKRGRLKRFFFI